MKKSILNLNGAKSLNKKEQATIKGGFGPLNPIDSSGCECWFYNYPLAPTCLSYTQTCKELQNEIDK